MAARGSESKNIITEKILSTFENSFKYDKEIRVPMIENGEEVQIKITLTAAKTNVQHGEDTALPGDNLIPNAPAPEVVTVNVPTEPSPEEKQTLEQLINTLF